MVPTADVNVTFAMSITVFALTIYYSIKAKTLFGWLKELVTAPFHAHGVVGIVLLAIPTCSSTWSSTCRSRSAWRCDCSATCTPAN